MTFSLYFDRIDQLEMFIDNELVAIFASYVVKKISISRTRPRTRSETLNLPILLKQLVEQYVTGKV